MLLHDAKLDTQSDYDTSEMLPPPPPLAWLALRTNPYPNRMWNAFTISQQKENCLKTPKRNTLTKEAKKANNLQIYKEL